MRTIVEACGLGGDLEHLGLEWRTASVGVGEAALRLHGDVAERDRVGHAIFDVGVIGARCTAEGRVVGAGDLEAGGADTPALAGVVVTDFLGRVEGRACAGLGWWVATGPASLVVGGLGRGIDPSRIGVFSVSSQPLQPAGILIPTAADKIQPIGVRARSSCSIAVWARM